MAVYTVTKGSLLYEVADGIGVPHCFTTRLGGVSAGHVSSLNLSMRRDHDPQNVVKNFHILGDALGFDPKKLILSNQTHSITVRKVTAADHRGFNTHDYPECDALITDRPGTALCVFTADCTPILLWDPVTGAVGAVHAGWRGTAGKIVCTTVLSMMLAYGCRPEDMRAAIGPNIGGCCFETDPDVPQALLEAYGEEAAGFITRGSSGKYYPDLKAINALGLTSMGLRHIDISGDCTMCSPDRYWSHRFTKGHRGSQGAIILCKGANP